MNSVLMVAVSMILSATLLCGSADAAGCLKGAAVGGVAGHYPGNHGVLGAGVGCVVGRHHANKQARQEMTNNSRQRSTR